MLDILGNKIDISKIGIINFGRIEDSPIEVDQLFIKLVQSGKLPNFNSYENLDDLYGFLYAQLLSGEYIILRAVPDGNEDRVADHLDEIISLICTELNNSKNANSIRKDVCKKSDIQEIVEKEENVKENDTFNSITKLLNSSRPRRNIF